ncbi:MAG: hypothetical protein M1815_000732 [Lichina confinis]|nr:MAG: hypothetical protein M1815_000732 [Lichina confinis]
MLKKPRSQAPMPVLFAAPVPTLVVYQHARNSQHAFSQRLPKQYRGGAQDLRPVSLEVANTYVEHMFHEQGRRRNGADRLLYAATKPLRFEQVCQSLDLLVPSKQGHIGTLEDTTGGYQLVGQAKVDIAKIARYLDRGPGWTSTTVWSCALDLVIVAGIVWSAWHTSTHVGGAIDKPNKTRSALIRAIRHNRSLAREQPNKTVKGALESALAHTRDPNGKFLNFSLVWTEFTRGLRQIKVGVLPVDTYDNCKAIIAGVRIISLN